jgi:SAM-dependent methyltransferase
MADEPGNSDVRAERDYVLGTHDEEIERLGVQHRVWRARALDAWQRAGFAPCQTILDVGCGPGYATVDLAEIVGPQGRVVAIDRSRRFLDALEATRGQRRLEQIEPVELDLDEDALPDVSADGAWSRWVFAFVRNPRALLERVAGRLRSGGALVLHEYFDYGAWRVSPRSPEFEEMVSTVIEGWRASGGEPDIALDLPRWLLELDFELRALTPIVHFVPPASPIWQWPKSFIGTALARLVELGRLTPQRAREIGDAFAATEAGPNPFMVMPAVLEIVAVRR